MLKQKVNGSVAVEGLEQYPSTLSMYSLPPLDEIGLYEFETFALDRLQVLRAVETARIRCKSDEEISKFIDPVLQKHLPLKRNSRLTSQAAKTLFEERRRDHISHFILRLAYCKNEDLRRWFIKQEAALFKVIAELISDSVYE